MIPRVNPTVPTAEAVSYRHAESVKSSYTLIKTAPPKNSVSAEIAKLHAETEFEKYRVIQDRLFMSDFDKYMLELEENAKK